MNCGILQTPSGSSGRAIPGYFYAKMHPKLQLSSYFYFFVNPEHELGIKMPAVGFPSRASKKQLTSYSSILPFQKGSPIAFLDFSAPLATRILLVSSISCGILQATSGSSGLAIPVYFLAKMHPKPYSSNYLHFLVNP